MPPSTIGHRQGSGSIGAVGPRELACRMAAVRQPSQRDDRDRRSDQQIEGLEWRRIGVADDRDLHAQPAQQGSPDEQATNGANRWRNQTMAAAPIGPIPSTVNSTSPGRK